MKAASLPQTLASSYDYLNRLYEKVSDDPGGKNLMFLCKFCQLGFKKQIRISATSTANLKRHIELNHPASLSRYVQNLTHSFSVKTEKIIAACGFIWVVALILKNNSLNKEL